MVSLITITAQLIIYVIMLMSHSLSSLLLKKLFIVICIINDNFRYFTDGCLISNVFSKYHINCLNPLKWKS